MESAFVTASDISGFISLIRTYHTLVMTLLCSVIATAYSAESFSASDVDGDSIVVEVRDNQGVRDIAEEYLNDPDGWMDILRANNLTDPHEIRKGMKLRVPVKAIQAAKQAMESAQSSITKATLAGAKLFAPETIASAVQLWERAIDARKAGRLQECESLATSSVLDSEKAYHISMQNQNIPAEAVVQNLKGSVHSRKPSEILWKTVSKFDVLLEGERIRTLSQSYAEILFRDDSVLHLKENAQALIQKMRANMLDESEDVKVSLIKGDVFALLGGAKKDKGVSVEVPGLETKIKSQEYWISKDDNGARIANYEGEIEITSAGATVVLQKNQGSVVPKNKQPSIPSELLPPPELISPENNEVIHMDRIVFKWREIAGAIAYMVEIASEPSFSSLLHSETIIGDSHSFPASIVSGIYYWRVMAVSSEKLPGRPSETRFFRLAKNDQVPFLVVQSPVQNAVTTEKTLVIQGQTETGVQVFIIGKPVKISQSGSFQAHYHLASGENLIKIKAVNPAGVSTEIERKVWFYPPDEIFIVFDNSLPKDENRHFLTPNKGFTLTGRTVPTASIFVRSLIEKRHEPSGSAVFSAASVSDKDGNFQINIRLSLAQESFEVTVQSLGGNIRKETVTIQLDQLPPVITLFSEIPTQTSLSSIFISGIAKDAVQLYLNKTQTPLQDYKFSLEVNLSPGDNLLRFEAYDRVRNLAVLEKNIIFDNNPPELISSTITPLQIKGGETPTVAVYAKDATSLAKTAPYSVKVGSYSFSGILVLSANKDFYSGSFYVPEQISGSAAISFITLSDHLGNRKTYRFDN